MATIEVDFGDGSSARWGVSTGKGIIVAAKLIEILGQPDTVKV